MIPEKVLEESNFVTIGFLSNLLKGICRQLGALPHSKDKAHLYH